MDIACTVKDMVKSPSCPLVKLTLENVRFISDGVKEVASGLRDNTTLQSLSFTNNDIGNLGAKYLGVLLTHNTTITSLSLSCLFS